MSNTVGYSLGCVTPVRYDLTQGEDATGNGLGYALGGCSGCWNGDYRERRYWAQIPISTTATSGTDYYGALAPTLKFQGGGTYREICPTVCYCEGPTEEGATVVKYLGRYETRWMALLVEGLIYYGRVDGTLIQAPLDLFPDPLPDTATHIALSFDANARPVFAYEDEGTIYVRRYVADVPTTYSWIGTEPCLFFNGVINFDDSLTDVVCYYLTESGGALYARFQRENFGVANLVIEDPGFDSLMAVDRGRGALASFMVIELSGKRVFAAIYPPWPVVEREAPLRVIATPAGGSYWPILITLPLATDSIGLAAAPAGGEYWAIRITFPTVHESLGLAAAPAPTGNKYWPIRIDAGTYHEFVGLAAAPAPTGNRYWLVRVDAGTYDDSIGVAAAPATDGNKYWLVRISAGTYSDDIAVSATPAGGTYAAV